MTYNRPSIPADLTILTVSQLRKGEGKLCRFYSDDSAELAEVTAQIVAVQAELDQALDAGRF